jgi:hypothetical protein
VSLQFSYGQKAVILLEFRWAHNVFQRLVNFNHFLSESGCFQENEGIAGHLWHTNDEIRQVLCYPTPDRPVSTPLPGQTLSDFDRIRIVSTDPVAVADIHQPRVV